MYNYLSLFYLSNHHHLLSIGTQDSLKQLKQEGKALPEVINIGKKVQTQKQVHQEGEVDWEVVDKIMPQKIIDAEEHVKMLNKSKFKLKNAMKVGGLLPKDKIQRISRARSNAKKIADEIKKKNIVKVSRYETKKQEKCISKNLLSFLTHLMQNDFHNLFITKICLTKSQDKLPVTEKFCFY